MTFIEKLRALSEPKKIAIFFVVMGISALICGFVGVRLIVHDLSKIKNFPTMADLPTIDLPKLPAMAPPAPVVSDGQSEGWKQYTDSALGFSLEYPADMAVSTAYIADSPMVIFQSVAASGGLEKMIRVCPKNCGEQSGENEWVLNAKPETVADKPANVYREQGGNSRAFVYFTQAPSAAFAALEVGNLQKGGWFDVSLDNTSLVDRVVNSFKFIP